MTRTNQFNVNIALEGAQTGTVHKQRLLLSAEQTVVRVPSSPWHTALPVLSVYHINNSGVTRFFSALGEKAMKCAVHHKKGDIQNFGNEGAGAQAPQKFRGGRKRTGHESKKTVQWNNECPNKLGTKNSKSLLRYRLL